LETDHRTEPLMVIDHLRRCLVGFRWHPTHCTLSVYLCLCLFSAIHCTIRFAVAPVASLP
jgi:hypothetical protein